MKLNRRLLWVLLLVPVALGLLRVRFDVEVLNLLPDEFPVVKGLKLYQRSFSNARELIITVEAGDPAVSEHAAQRIAERLRQESKLVASAIWQPPFFDAPDQSAELIAYLWLNHPGGSSALARRLGASHRTNTLLSAREELATSFSPDSIAKRAYDPYSLMDLAGSDEAAGSSTLANQGLFASADGSFRVVFVEAATELASYPECAAWLREIQRRVQEETRESPPVEVGYTGRPAFVSEIAGGMERDILTSVGSTLIIISALFYAVHRRWRPLLWLVLLLGVILACATALGGLLFGALNGVSLGFAAILSGLAVDYGLVLYQETRSAPGRSLREVRRGVGPGILWSATTTAAAFVMLNASGLPGLGQLGSLVSIGLLLAAGIMLYAFLPPLVGGAPPSATAPAAPASPAQRRAWGTWTATALIVAAGLFILSRGGPSFDPSADALRPAHSAAYTAVEKMKDRMMQSEEPLWLLVRGRSEAEVAERLAATQTTLSNAVHEELLTGFTLTTALWPNPEAQAANLPSLKTWVQEREQIEAAAIGHGFTTNALLLTRRILNAWAAALDQPGVFWPTNPSSRWVMGKVAARAPDDLVTLGLLYPNPDLTRPRSGPLPALQTWLDQLQSDNVIISGWQLMGVSIFKVVQGDLPGILIPMVALTVVALSLAFRSVKEAVLSGATLLVSALALWSVMTLAGWSWNLINMMALPLLLGAGVDYSIHMQLGLRRHQGDVNAVLRTVGRALLLCAATTFTAFTSLAFSSNSGLASLGKVCAAGVLCAFVSAVVLLPGWWVTLQRRS